MTIGQGQRMTVTSESHLAPSTHLVECFNQLWVHRLNSFQKINNFRFSSWPNLILGHNLNNPGSIAIYDAAYQVSRSWANWFWRRRFLRFLPYMSMVAKTILINLVTIGPVVSEEKSFEIVDGRTIDNAACLSYYTPLKLLAHVS